ncbi:MAG: hypothetical protein AAB116_21120 [Candidatus Poribacteria bacterium]
MKKAIIVLCILFALILLTGCNEEPQKLEGQGYRTFVDFLFWCFTDFWRWLGLVILAGTIVGGAMTGPIIALRKGKERIEDITESVRLETQRIDELNRRIEELTEEVRKLHRHKESE